MTGPNISSIMAALLLFCGLSGAFPSGLGGAEAAAPKPRRSDIVGGTDFPDLYHYTDPVTRTEVWGVRPPSCEEKDPPAPPIIVSPEVLLPWPSPADEPGTGGGRP